MRERSGALLLFIFLLYAIPVQSAPFTGIRGRAAVSGQTVDGVKVYAFERIEDLFDCKPAGRSKTTDVEGLYSLELSPGRYWVVGYGGDKECPTPSGGDLFCFYGGNPIVVESGKPTNVGLSMVRVRPDPELSGKKGITGYVYDEEGDPLKEAVAYFYRNPDGGLRGIPDYFTRTNGKGMFRARIGKGNYFVVVRKRQDGEVFGPTRIGDHFGYYPKNPVHYDGLSNVTIRIDAVMRLSQLEKFEGFEEVSHGARVRGVVLDDKGIPVPDYYVFAYGGEERTGMPDAISGKSDAKGNFELTLFEGGHYRLVARRRPGGPVENEPTGEREVDVEPGDSIDGVVITLEVVR